MKVSNKLAAIMTALLLCSGSIPVSAGEGIPTYTSGALTYVYLDDGSIGIADCDRSVTEMDVPAEIDGKPVTVLLDNAFGWVDQMERITIPDSVTYIGQSCFYNCKALKTVDLGEGVCYLDRYAFQYCDSLEEIRIPASVQLIEHSAFEFCTSLQTVEIGDGVVYIGDYAFSGCTALQTAVFGSGVSYIGNNAFSNTQLTEVTLPPELTFLEQSTFSGCTALEKAVLPDGLQGIGPTAFDGCASLTACNIPVSVSSVGRDAFAGTPLTDEPETGPVILDQWVLGYNGRALGEEQYLTIPDGVRGIADYGLQYADCITLTLPDSVLYLGEYLCAHSLKSVRMSENLLTMGDGAFADCTDLGKVDIPESVVYMGEDPFQHTAWSAEQPEGAVYLDGWLLTYNGPLDDERQLPENTQVVIQEGTVGIAARAFENLSVGYVQENLVSVELPESLRFICDAAFQDCVSLTDIRLPEGLLLLGEAAFAGTGLTELTIPADVIAIGEKACGFAHDVGLYSQIDSFTIYGCTGSEAEAYAAYYGFDFVPVGEIVYGLRGDINLDGSVDTADVMLLQDYLLAKPVEIPGEADLNGDGSWDVYDLAILKNLCS